MAETSKPRNTFIEYLLAMPIDEEFAEIMDHIRDCGCGLSKSELHFLAALCDRALTAGPQLWQREGGNLVVLSETEFRAFAGHDVTYDRVWPEADDPRGG